MRILALATGLLLLTLAALAGPGLLEPPASPGSGIWLRVADRLPATASESRLAERGGPLGEPAQDRE